MIEIFLICFIYLVYICLIFLSFYFYLIIYNYHLKRCQIIGLLTKLNPILQLNQYLFYKIFSKKIR
jgi:hypothetical protein